MSKPDLLRRREALAALGALGLGAAVPRLRALAGTEDAEAASCVLMPELTEGPYGVRNNLRGRQKSDADGVVRFDTIYPGWYRGRTPHIRESGGRTTLRLRRRGSGYRATLALGVS